MQMRPVEGGIMLAPRSYQELQPGGLHIMLINLTQPLVAGETIELTLNFERMGAFSVQVPIVDMAVSEDASSERSMMQPEATPLPTVSSVEWSPECARIHVLGAWSRPAGAGMPTSAAYGLLINLTDEADTLVSAESAVATVVELHEMKIGDGDVMQMRPVEGGISIPAGGAVVLQPGGLHVMLIDLQQALEVDTTMELTLNFANAEPITLEIPVQEPVVEEMPMNAGGMRLFT
jgi:copper(I)-binding protein